MRLNIWLAVLIPALALSPARAAAPADVLDKAPSKFAKSGDLKVHYKSLGEGKTAVVFVHGWSCDNSVWRDQAAAFDGKARLLFVDLPGYGKSDAPKIDYTMDVFAKGVDAVLQDAGVDSAVLVGHSMGTPVILRFYRLFPDKTKALVFVDGTVRPLLGDPARIKQLEAMFKEETFKDSAPRFVAGMFPPGMAAELRDRIQQLVANTDPHAAVSSMHNMLDAKSWSGDPVKAPAQALMANSPMWTDDYKAYAKKLVPDLDYREFDGVGHFLFMEKPQPFNEALAEFLKKQGMIKKAAARARGRRRRRPSGPHRRPIRSHGRRSAAGTRWRAGPLPPGRSSRRR
jgi:pimeloyl-ACP methyl ester carboxylesterase